MPGEDFLESEPENNQGDPAEANDSARDTIPDWPADAIAPEETWVPGQQLSYFQPRAEPIRAFRRPPNVSPIIGPLAHWFSLGTGACSCGAIIAMKIMNILRARHGAPAIGFVVEQRLVLLGFCFGLAGIVLGTVGRLNPEGRRAAIRGRRLGCATPLLIVILMIVLGIGHLDLRDALGFCAAMLVFGFLIILVSDAILES